ncbi:hypothetical protein BDD12DRAFT_771398 [Trichophaea hybrida]|nr:hypothetical protein BDD12DRAFT_771398 [Trichophaea hybrida]
MPGRIKLSYQASVETQPAAVSKRKTSSTIRAPAAKRTKATEKEPSDPAAPRAPRQSRSSANSRTTSSATSPQPDNDTPNTTPPSQFSAVVKTTTKKKQASKPREKKFACTYEDCNKSFTRPCRLEEHLRSHTGDRPFKCTLDPENCDKSFLRDSHLKAHIKAMHSKEKPYRCAFLIPPGKEDDRGEFGFKRKASEPAEGFEDNEDGMKECGARFSTNQHLKRHVESHLKTFPYICKDHPPCSAGFRKKGPLTRHIRSEHLGQQPWACSHKDIKDPSKPCSAAFDTKGKLGNHVATQHNGLARRRYICTICITSPAEPTADLTASSGFNTALTGPIDLDRFPADKNAEDASLLLSLSQATFPVIQAPPPPQTNPETMRTEGMLGFTTHAELRAHITAAHPPVCIHCGYIAKRQGDLRTHVREKHEASLEERRNWICGWEGCGQGFTKKSNLTVHTATVHQGLKPFLCTYPECGKRFGHKSVLARHVEARHTPGSDSNKKKAKAPRKRRTRVLGLVQMLTGVGYAESGRDIECVVEGCEYRFCRMYDLKKHLGAASAHAFDEAQVEELIKEGNITMTTTSKKVQKEVELEVEFTETEESESEWSLAGSETEDGNDYLIDDDDD